MFEEKLSGASLSAEDLELLARVRTLRREQEPPEALRSRVCARVAEEARRDARRLSVRVARFVPVARWSSRPGLWFAGVTALGVCLTLAVIRISAPFDERAAGQVEPASEARAQQTLASRLLGGSRFGAAARALPAGQRPALAPNLLGAHPFSEQDNAFQLRRWDDLTSDPGLPAEHDFVSGGLCAPLVKGARVLAGWPWPREGEPAPERVALKRGTAYRLTFQAWAREPLPSEAWIGVGHAKLPFSASAGARVPLSGEPRVFEVDFVAEQDDPNVGVAFLVSGPAAGGLTKVCIRDVALTAPPRP